MYDIPIFDIVDISTVISTEFHCFGTPRISRVTFLSEYISP